MRNRKINFKIDKELQEEILREKMKGTPDAEIGRKYGVTFRCIEHIITQSEGINVSSIRASKKIKKFQPENFEEEQTTVWSFKQRGSWATHSGEYRGNWSPYIPRNVILRYSRPDELVLDCFCGAGTTAVECKLLERRCIAMDINDKAIELAKKNLDFRIDARQITLYENRKRKVYEPELRVGDARDLSFLQDNSVDLICTHPPYANIIQYTNKKEGDLSFYNIEGFLKEMDKVARECFRVLKPGRQCAILIGDARRKKHVVPLGFKLIRVFLDAGFKLRELVIKRQHNCKTTGFWYANSIKYNFLLLAHEYLPIFEKPEASDIRKICESNARFDAVSPVLEMPITKKSVDKLETTTVWAFPTTDLEARLNKNVIERYSSKGDCMTISFVSSEKPDIKIDWKNNREKMGLLFIKSPFLNDNFSYSNIEYYLNEIRNIVTQRLSNINKNGFLVIQTRDVRIDGYIEPLALKIAEVLSDKDLWLKEIVVVTPEGKNLNRIKAADYLKIVHQYLLVYEVRL